MDLLDSTQCIFSTAKRRLRQPPCGVAAIAAWDVFYLVLVFLAGLVDMSIDNV